MKQKVLVIVGPTAVGKSQLSIELAKQFNGEIISGDSMQVYKELSIGTAKITEEEMQNIPHHCINTHSYNEEYNVKVFQQEARNAIDNIHRKQKLPIVCGGTGLYIKSLIYDYDFVNEIRDDKFQMFLESLSNQELHYILKHVDDNAFQKIHINNRKRVIRAIEIAQTGVNKTERENRQQHKLIYDVVVIGLTMNRETLYQRINHRVDVMLENGLYQEIKTLVEDDNDIWNYQSFLSIGYREWKPYFKNECSYEEVKNQIKKNSRNFAKRQYTWFQNQLDVKWFSIDNKDWKLDLQLYLKDNLF